MAYYDPNIHLVTTWKDEPGAIDTILEKSKGYIQGVTNIGTRIYRWSDGTGVEFVPTMSILPTFNDPAWKVAGKKLGDPGVGVTGSLIYGDTNPTANMSLLYSMNDTDMGLTDWYRFDRWYSVDLQKDTAPSGRHYIFILRPDLNLVEQDGAGAVTNNLNTKNGIATDQFFQYIAAYHPEIIASLTGEFRLKQGDFSTVEGGTGNSVVKDKTVDRYANSIPMHAFMPFLTGRVESLQLPDYNIKNYSLVQPYTRYSIPYAASAIESQTGGSFDLTFRDDKYFSIRKLFYAWIYYMDGVMRNKFQPKEKYILYNAFDYATSVYDIVVDETGENIIWWSKYTGCFPTSVPISDLSFNKGSAPEAKVSIPFVYYHYEPMDIGALIDLNYNSLGYNYVNGMIEAAGNAAPLHPPVYASAIYNITTNYTGSFLGKNQVGRPVIFAQPPNGTRQGYLKLRWLPMPV